MSYARLDEVLLDINGVSLDLGGKCILRDVNVQIKDNDVIGQVVCFLGPSGIGKTQLSRVIAGLQLPTGGSVTLRGGGLTAPGSVCMVPQNYPLFEWTTVRGNLIIAGKQDGLNAKASLDRAQQYIDAFSLGDHLDKYPKELSGGTRQRVAIVRQLMCASTYLVMDEPFSGLDPVMKRAAMDCIVKLSTLDTYNTIIIVTHDVTEGMSIADMVWLMGKDQGVDGATIKAIVDLAKMGLAWRPDIQKDPVFHELVLDVKDRFNGLRGA